LKKIGLEVIVRVGGQKRTIILPPAMAAYRPKGARFEGGALEVHFERSDERVPADDATT
jgi:HSP20-like domain found in ArsA